MTPRYVPPGDIHPEELWKLLGHLSPERRPLPWDTKVERLVNGLKDPHLYIGRTLSDNMPWLLHRSLLQGHGHVLGGTRSGKTSRCLVPLITQLCAWADSSIIVFDLKVDLHLFYSTFIEASRAGLPFRWFTIEPGAASFAFNPFTQRHNQQRGVNARAQSLLMALGLYFGDAYGKTYYQSISLDTLTAFLTKFRDIRSFADLARYAEEPGSYKATKTDQDNSQQLRMLLRQLTAAEALNVTDSSKVRPEVCRDAIDMSDVVTQKQVIYFSLPSLEEELTAKSIAKLGLYALVAAAKTLNRTRRTVPCYVILDEFQQVCAENLTIILEMARSLGIHLVLSHQDISQLKTADYDITSTVESNTTFKLTFEASSLTAMKQMEEYSGETRERTLSWIQAVHAGLDENSDDALALDRAHSTEEFELPTATVSERERPTLTRNQILAVSAHPLRGFVRSRSDSGLTQYAGQWVPIECEFPTTLKEFDDRSNTPLPSTHPSCITVGTGNDDEGATGTVPSNGPLPVPPAPASVDKALADRLQALQDAIGKEHTENPNAK